MATPIRHSACGEIVMYYIGPRLMSWARSRDIVYLDGTRPTPCSALPECPHCSGNMTPGFNLQRCFDEDVDPGFDIDLAVRNGKLVSPPPGPPNRSLLAFLARQRKEQAFLALLVCGAAATVLIVALIKAV